MKNLMFKKVVQINNFFIFYFNKINEFVEKQNEENRRATNQEQMGDEKKIYGPNINPSSTYNF